MKVKKKKRGRHEKKKAMEKVTQKDKRGYEKRRQLCQEKKRVMAGGKSMKKGRDVMPRSAVYDETA